MKNILSNSYLYDRLTVTCVFHQVPLSTGKHVTVRVKQLIAPEVIFTEAAFTGTSLTHGQTEPL